MTGDTFHDRLQALRPRLHRYCARMTGSAVDGEDVVQEALLKAHLAQGRGAEVQHLEAWLFRIAHNASLDFLRHLARRPVVALTEDLAAESGPDPDLAAMGFRTFLRLPELQRAAVILSDVLGHSIAEIAAIAGCSVPAAKSALQRGRAGLRRVASAPPRLEGDERRRLAAYVSLFQTGDFDGLRAMLAEEVQLDLVNRLRLAGKDGVAPYFARYAAVPTWRFVLGAVEGRPAMLVFAQGHPERPAHMALIGWQGDKVLTIRDYLFAPHVLQDADWQVLSGG